jgi:hypothetical protein
MGWLFAQVWILCVVAFLAGAGVTWVLFVVPQRRTRPARRAGSEEPGAWTADPWAGRAGDAREPVDPPAPPPAVDPALSALDSLGRDRVRRVPSAGTAATGALDLLGVLRATPPADDGPGPRIPAREIPPSPAPDQEAPRGGPAGRAPEIPEQAGPVDVPGSGPGEGGPV